MKKFLALLLALLMCVGVLAACGKKDEGNDTAAAATLDEAKELLNSMMKDKNGKATPNDYDVVGALKVGDTKFEVTWKTDKENIKVKESSKEGFWTIDVPDVNTEEVEYKLTATIKDANGDTVEVTFTPKLPVIDNAGVATEFEAGVAYKIFMKQINVGVTVYALNTTQKGENKFIETTLDPKAAATYYVEVVEGGYKIYTEIDGVKNYLHATATPKETGTGFTKAIGFAKETDCVFTYDKELALFKVKLSGEEFGVGSYNAYETISISEVKYFTADKINVEGGQFPIGLMTKEHADTLAPSEKPANNDPAADSLLSIADAIALGKSKTSSIYTDSKYYVEGTVKEIKSDVYGNLIITDGTNDLLIYGTYSEDGKTRFDKLATKPAVGDKIKVYGVIGNYNNEAQMKNGWIIGANAGGNTGDNTGDAFDDVIGNNVVTEFAEGVAYKAFMKQINKNTTYYVLNTTQKGENKYIETSTNPKDAATFYVEVVTGGYKIYTEIDGVKNYLHAELKEGSEPGKYSKYIGFKADSECVFTYDAALGVFKITLNGAEYGVGTYQSYTTVSLSDASYFKADNINVKDGQFPFGFITAEFAATLEGEEGGTTPTPEVVYEECTISEALAKDDNTAVKVSGIVTKVNYAWSTKYNNMSVTITDATGASIYAYKLANEVANGDYITISGKMGTYNGRQIAEGATAEIGTADDAHKAVFEAMNAANITTSYSKDVEVTLPTEALKFNATIAWTKDDAAITVLSIPQTDAEQTVTLKVTATVGEASYTAEVVVTVSAKVAAPEPGEGGTITASKTIAELITSEGWDKNTTKQEFNLDNVVTCKVNGGQNSGKAYTDDIRIYATDTPAGTLTITLAEGYELVSVKISTESGTYAFLCVDGSNADISNLSAAVSGSSVVLNSVKNGDDGKHVRITAIEVVYKAVNA